MRKIKKINGYLVVRFNDREKRGYPTLGSFGVIDAELYTGHIDVDFNAFEYDDADTIEVAVEQARGLDAEQDFSDEAPFYTVVTETAEEVKEEEVEPDLLVNGMETKLKTQIKSKGFPYITPTTAAHELVGYRTALNDLGLLDEDDAVIDLHHFGELCEFQDDDGHHIEAALPSSEGMALLSPHDYEEGETFMGCTVQTLKCRRCGHESFAWSRGPDTLTPQEVRELRNLKGLLKEMEDYVNGEDSTPPPGEPGAERNTFVNLDPSTKESPATRRVYSLGKLLESDCPENDCCIYLNIFRMAKSLDATLDGLDASGYPAQVLRHDLRQQLRELQRMYLENYAVQQFKEGMQK